MKRVTKKLLTFFIGTVFVVIYCEFLIYYIFTAQCSWPELPASGSPNELKALVIADLHMLGPYRGHWLDKWRREWQMHQAFQSIMTLHQPETVFILGDLFDEGEWTNEKQFEEYVQRFHKLFAVGDGVTVQVIVGNHDIGFHYNIWPGSTQRFYKALNTSSVKLVTLKDSHFILINSMAMEGDRCRLCREASYSLDKIAELLECSKHPSECAENSNLTYSQPILMQHFPLFRISDAECTEPDAPPLPLRNQKFRNKIDALSKEATDYLKRKFKPRAMFGGHTHHGCVVHHKDEENDIDFYEYSVPSFSWRNRPDPKYMLDFIIGTELGIHLDLKSFVGEVNSHDIVNIELGSHFHIYVFGGISLLLVTISPHSYAVNKCALPKESTIASTGAILFFAVSYYTFKRRLIGRR